MGSYRCVACRQVTDDLLEKSRHLHVASYFLQTALKPGLPGLFHRAHSFGLTTSLDTNWDPAEQWTGVQSLLDMTDIFLPNAAEAQAITALPDTGAAALSLAQHASYSSSETRRTGRPGSQRLNSLSMSRPSLPKLVDTVGAGDSFDAGFLYGLSQPLVNGKIFEAGDSMRRNLDPICRRHDWSGNSR